MFRDRPHNQPTTADVTLPATAARCSSRGRLHGCQLSVLGCRLSTIRTEDQFSCKVPRFPLLFPSLTRTNPRAIRPNPRSKRTQAPPIRSDPAAVRTEHSVPHPWAARNVLWGVFIVTGSTGRSYAIANHGKCNQRALLQSVATLSLDWDRAIHEKGPGRQVIRLFLPLQDMVDLLVNLCESARNSMPPTLFPLEQIAGPYGFASFPDEAEFRHYLGC
jgi:hypothetical protein